MSISSATYLTSIVENMAGPETNLPIYALIGRSNVGKSSLINSLTKTKNLARSGSTPGVTKKINLFVINKKCILADLPGYGYAKLGKQQRNEIQHMINWFIKDFTPKPQHVLLLMEAKVGPTKDDLQIISKLKKNKLPFTAILTKTDKLNSSEKNNLIKNMPSELENIEIIPLSITSPAGKKRLLEIIQA